MKKNGFVLDGITYPVYCFDTLVVGSGCAGFNAADSLYNLGRRSIAMLTEGINMGTSRNAGSDKQTYYKLCLAGDVPDSIFGMAKTLFSYGGMHGDTALIEAACSVRSFMKLVNLGVAFPTNRYGEYVGYKTDHDNKNRGTSVGPYTSKYMTEALEKSVRAKNIPIFDNMLMFHYLISDGKIQGVAAINTEDTHSGSAGLTLFLANNIVMATGGPAGIYKTSVFPESQTGMTGAAIEAGAQCANLQEWQYGLASIKFRWNVSGTYQQVLPRYISIDSAGREREFLPDYFPDPLDALNMVFLKGYQWPFDVCKLDGSSIIDIIIYNETILKGNRVYMDFTREPAGLEQGNFSGLGEDAYRYLSNSDALLELPVRRLEKMNPRAISLYLDHGIDLYKEPLEVMVCAQHCNGGVAVDMDWQSDIEGLYAAGEVAGTFGTYRPGGSALSSGQTGSLRAAEHIAVTKAERIPHPESFSANGDTRRLFKDIISLSKLKGTSNYKAMREKMQTEMSRFAACIRDAQAMVSLFRERKAQLDCFFDDACCADVSELPEILRNRDILITQTAVLSAMCESAENFGSRGSGLLTGDEGRCASPMLEDIRYLPGKINQDNKIVITRLEKTAGFVSGLIDPRPLPEDDSWFETVWNEYNERFKNCFDYGNT